MTSRTMTLVRADGTRTMLEVLDEQWLDAPEPSAKPATAPAPAPSAKPATAPAPEPSAKPAPAPVVPVVGMGATEYCYSDIRAYTVIAVSASGKRCTVQRDRAKLLNGANSGEADALQFSPGGYVGHTSGRQRWEISRDPTGETHEISRRRDGSWRIVGYGMDSSRFELGKRVERYDFNF